MRLQLFASLPLLLALTACDSADPAASDSGGPSPDDTGATAAALGRCDYVNPFSSTPECKDYTGAAWALDTAQADCAAPVVAADPGQFVEGQACPRDAVVGECTIGAGTDTETVIVVPGDDPEACASAELGCTFAGGDFSPGEVCVSAGEGEGVPSEEAFVPFEQLCRDPLEGEPAGQGPDGQVCTWQAISGATEEGRHFEDYADCAVVVQQRPYWPAMTETDTSPTDPRLSDPLWVEEYAWVTEQVQATACVCCHSSALAPDGAASGWHLEDGPIWVDGLDDDGLAVLAGWVDSTVFGAFPADQNNGFGREQTGMPSTDPDRMQGFLAGELARRGRSQDSFSDTLPFGGPLYDQLIHQPQACGEGQGVDADGMVRWTGGPARYLYVLEEGADNPGVPPNLDLPEGTLWRLDVSHTADPVASGVPYGASGDTAPDGTSQAWPEDGDAPALVPGQTYYLVALLDIYQPATRCLFTAQQ